MTEELRLNKYKEQIKAAIRSNSDRGFVNYSGCIRLSMEMMSVVEQAEAEAQSDPVLAFDIVVMVINEVMKLISHADDSSGSLGEAIRDSMRVIDEFCQSIDESNHKYFFDTIIKSAKRKAMKEWPDFGYGLLQSVVHLIHEEKQVRKVNEGFEALGTLYSGSKYPEEYVITYKITNRLEGPEAADRYLISHIEVPGLRSIAVEKALEEKNYALAEELCITGRSKEEQRFNRNLKWDRYLERIYSETSNQTKLIEVVYGILAQGDTSYYRKLQQLWEAKGTWEQQKEPLLQKLSVTLPNHYYASVLHQADEFEKLLELLGRDNSLIMSYGQQVAKRYPDEVHPIYEAYILDQAQHATDRRKYRETCRFLKEYYDAGAKQESVQLIDRLSAMYPRRSAMLDELSKLKGKLEK